VDLGLHNGESVEKTKSPKMPPTTEEANRPQAAPSTRLRLWRASSRRRRPPSPPAATSPPPLSRQPHLPLPDQIGGGGLPDRRRRRRRRGWSGAPSSTHLDSSRLRSFASRGAHTEPEPASFAIHRGEISAVAGRNSGRRHSSPPPVSLSMQSSRSPPSLARPASIQRRSDRFGSRSDSIQRRGALAARWNDGRPVSSPPLAAPLPPFQVAGGDMSHAGGRRGMDREERGDLVLPSCSRARQNGSSVWVLSWRLFLCR
jgi:hypothetical protein